ncbi:MAG TPA: hypothetical protein VKK79_18290, partial [Candidatus Lokiarchaeia archaeon]|nr:hypothetical protein [Candidatus Lokiarchaeia archaeon]
DQVDARNTLVTTLAEIVELPLGQFAFTVTFNGKDFCLLRTSTEECVGQVPATPQLIEVWGNATGKGSQELRLSKAFNIATAQNQAAKVRDTIEGAWVPYEWDIQISPL